MQDKSYVSPRGPEYYRVAVETSAGRFEIEVNRSWSPHAADRFHDLACARYFDDSRFFRVVSGKWVQFGIAGDPATARLWRDRAIPDDVLKQPNHRGFVAFSNTGPRTRSTQIYINLGDNSAQNDHEPAFAPFGEVTRGIATVEGLFAGYGETSGSGMRAGRQDALFTGGNRHLDTCYPRLDRLHRLAIVS